MNKLLLIAAAFLLLASPAFAQQPDPIQQLARDWSALNGSIVASDSAQAHVAEDLKAVIAEYQRAQKKLADLDAYLKKCGDKPGCTVPVKKSPKEP